MAELREHEKKVLEVQYAREESWRRIRERDWEARKLEAAVNIISDGIDKGTLLAAPFVLSFFKQQFQKRTT